MDVCGAEAELACACLKLDVLGSVGLVVDVHELASYGLCAVWGCVVDDDDFPVEVAVVVAKEMVSS